MASYLKYIVSAFFVMVVSFGCNKVVDDKLIKNSENIVSVITESLLDEFADELAERIIKRMNEMIEL